MADKSISAASPKASLAATDMIPVAAAGSAVAYHVTGQTVFDSIPDATTAQSGKVELATAAETAAATDTERAVTPAGLAANVGPSHLAAGFCYIGKISSAPLTYPLIHNKFYVAFGRYEQAGDLFTVADADDMMYILTFSSPAGAFCGIKIHPGTAEAIGVAFD